MSVRNWLRPAWRWVALGAALAMLGASSPAMAHDDDDDSNSADPDVRVYSWDGKELHEGDSDTWQWDQKDDERGDRTKTFHYKVERADMKGGYLGVQIQSITRALARARDLDSRRGALVNRVEEDGPADDAGIERGDVIIEVKGKDIDDASDLTRVIRDMKPGDRAKVVVIRDGRRKTIDVKLGKRPHDMMVVGPDFEWKGKGPDMKELREYLKGLDNMKFRSSEDRDRLDEEMSELRDQMRELRSELRELREELRDARERGSRSRSDR